MNRLYGDEDFTEELFRRQRRRRRIVVAISFLVALLFMLSLAAGGLRVLGGVSLKLLIESWSLASDPEIAGWREAVVRVDVVRPGGSVTGTGFNIDPTGLIVTNSHLLENAVAVNVTFPGMKQHKAVSWSAAREADLAVVVLEQDNLPLVELDATAKPSPGDEVTIIGNPLQLFGIIVVGRVGGYGHLTGMDNLVMGIEAPIQPGHSGSPVFNDTGKVVAVIYAMADLKEQDERIGLAIPSALVAEFLEQLQH